MFIRIQKYLLLPRDQATKERRSDISEEASSMKTKKAIGKIKVEGEETNICF